jgi:tetratricopeptide (TPR) repeat protein
MKHCAVVLLTLAMLYGCAHDINIHNAARYGQAGEAALQRGDWDGARRAYARAAVNADLGRAPVRARSVMYYEYGRTSGATCFYDLAETYLSKSLKLDEDSSGPVHLPLIELARLNLDQGKFTQAIPYFERALPVVDKLDAGSKDPIGFADFLDEYAQALTISNRASEASALTARAADIRSKHPTAASRTNRTPYGKHCTKKEESAR